MRHHTMEIEGYGPVTFRGLTKRERNGIERNAGVDSQSMPNTRTHRFQFPKRLSRFSSKAVASDQSYHQVAETSPVDPERTNFFAEDLQIDARAYEGAFRAALESSFQSRERWRNSEGIEIQEVSLVGEYPETQVAVIFRAAQSATIRFGQPTDDCRFGYRARIWPAEYEDPSTSASFAEVYFMEFLGTDRAMPLRGGSPCDPHQVNWLNS